LKGFQRPVRPAYSFSQHHQNRLSPLGRDPEKPVIPALSSQPSDDEPKVALVMQQYFPLQARKGENFLMSSTKRDGASKAYIRYEFIDVSWNILWRARV
jgi:hypothetical protein